MNAHGLPNDLDDAIFDALRELLGRQLAHSATEAVCEVLASRRDASRDMRVDPAPRIFGWQPEVAPRG